MLMCIFFSTKNNYNILNVDYLIISNITVLLDKHSWVWILMEFCNMKETGFNDAAQLKNF